MMQQGKSIQLTGINKIQAPHTQLSVEKVKINKGMLLHKNQITIKSATQSQEPMVKICPLVKHEDKLLKKLQVQIQGKVIVITDTFVPEFISQQVRKKQGQYHSLLPEIEEQGGFEHISSKHNHHGKNLQAHVCKEKDTKNVIKNIFRIFQRWIDQHSPPQLQFDKAIAELFQRRQKYNKKLMADIVNHAELRQAFVVFCYNEAKELINLSRIKDKETHFEIMGKYRQMCEEFFSSESQDNEGKQTVEDKIQESSIGNQQKGYMLKQEVIQEVNKEQLYFWQ